MSTLYLLKRFDKSQLFRFFVDGRFHRKEKYDGWVGYEARERGSVQAMLNGYAFMVDRFQDSHEVNCAYLRELHRVCLLHVESNNEKSSPGDIRYQETGLPFFQKTTTRENLAEILKMRLGDGTIVFHDRELRRRAEDLTADEAFALLQEKGKILYRGWYPNLDVSVAQALAQPRSLHEFYLAKHQVQMAMVRKMEDFAAAYQRRMREARSDADKLRAIALLVRELEILHPFPDGNCRVFACVLMNQLLMYHGFHPAIVRNPNLDFEYALDQWVVEIEAGMRNTQILLDHPEASVFDYSILEMDPADREKFRQMAAELSAKIDAYQELFLTPERLGAYAGGEWINPDPAVRYRGIGTHGSFQRDDLYFAPNLREWEAEGKDVAAELAKRVQAGVKGIVLDDRRYAAGIDIPVLVVDDAMAAFARVAAQVRREANPQTVLITGTEGKTGSKIQLHHLLGEQTGVHAWLSSANTVIPILKSLASLDVGDKVELNEVSVDADTAKTTQRSEAVGPDICFFSNISAEHMHVHQSIEGVVRHKSFVAMGMKPGGRCVVNSSMDSFSALLEEIGQRRSDVEVLTFGLRESDSARLIDAAFDQDRIGWRVQAAIMGEPLAYFVPLMQSHAPLMSVGVLLVVKLLGYDLARAAASYASFQPYESMGKLHRVELDGSSFLLYDQSRRASISGVRSVFKDIERLDVKGKVVALFGSISSTKDNEWTRGYHDELARLIGQSKVKRLYTTGPNIDDVPGKLADPSIFVMHSDDHERLYDEIMADIEPGDLLLIQGYLRLNLEEIAEKVLNHQNVNPSGRQPLGKFLDVCTAEQALALGAAIRRGGAAGAEGRAYPPDAGPGLIAGIERGAITYTMFRGRLLERFFSRLDRALETDYGLRCINREIVRSGYRVSVHNDEHCHNWFNGVDKLEGKPKKIMFGSFYDFGDKHYILEIMVGTANLHAGILKYALSDGKLVFEPMQEDDYRIVEGRYNAGLQGKPLERRGWGHKWMTIDCGDLTRLDDKETFSAIFDPVGSGLFGTLIAPLLAQLAPQRK